jgi:uncharacterized protein (TIGR02145 family)
MIIFSFLRNIPGAPAYLLAVVLFLLGSCAQEKMVWDLAKVPVVRTGSPTEIKHSSFRISAQVEGDEKLKEKGFCIAQTPNPTIKENKFLVDSGAASYSGLLNNLWADTLYYIRAYATNATGTGYSKPFEVKTLPGFCPVLQTNAPVLSNGDKDLASGGNILDDGGYPILAKGICWSLEPDPVAGQGNSTNEGAGRESFISRVNGLQPGKTYYLRAYATNKAGTCYGNLVSSNTQVSLPIISTNTATSITATTATSGGNITFDGGGNITARGICWSISQNPNTALITKTNDGTGTGSFTSNLTGLSPGTLYYIRVYATNSAGTAYGNQQTITTTTANLVDVDGNVYTTVTIGTQVWMAENLKTSKYRNGNSIPTNLTDADWTSATTGAYAIYNNNATNNTTYGKLYNWYSVVDSRNLCPAGWHVPSDAEWTILEYFLGGTTVAGGKMKTPTDWNSPNTGATNESGFSGLPGGYRQPNGTYSAIGNAGFLWSSTEYATTYAWYRILNSNYGDSGRTANYKQNGFSVRCLRD